MGGTQNPIFPVGGRRPNSDGTVTIYCRQCGQPICKQQYRGFSTVDQCYQCNTGNPLPMTEQEFLEQALFGEPDAPEKERVGLASYVFRAVGWLKKVREKPSKETRNVLKRKKRRPLFSSEKEDTPPDTVE